MFSEKHFSPACCPLQIRGNLPNVSIRFEQRRTPLPASGQLLTVNKVVGFPVARRASSVQCSRRDLALTASVSLPQAALNPSPTDDIQRALSQSQRAEWAAVSQLAQQQQFLDALCPEFNQMPAQQLQYVRNELQQRKQQINLLQKQLDDAREELRQNALQKHLKEEQERALRQKIANEQLLVTEKNELIEKLQSAIKRTVSNPETENEKIKQLEAQNQLLKQRLATAELFRVNEQHLDEMNAKKQDLKPKTEQTAAQSDPDIQKIINTLTNLLNLKDEAIVELEKTSRTAAARRISLEIENTRFLEEIEALKSQNGQLIYQNEHFKSQIGQSEEYIRSLQQQVITLNAQLSRPQKIQPPQMSPEKAAELVQTIENYRRAQLGSETTHRMETMGLRAQLSGTKLVTQRAIFILIQIQQQNLFELRSRLKNAEEQQERNEVLCNAIAAEFDALQSNRIKSKGL